MWEEDGKKLQQRDLMQILAKVGAGEHCAVDATLPSVNPIIGAYRNEDTETCRPGAAMGISPHQCRGTSQRSVLPNRAFDLLQAGRSRKA
jgi:hypothetical protein